MNLSELGVRRPVATAMLFASFVVVGVVALSRLGLDLMPEMEIPAVSVITAYQGAGPQEVESRITEPMEAQLATIPKVDEITSTSVEGVSTVTVKFAWGVRLDEATSDIRDKVDLVKSRLPDEADTPVILKFDLSMMPVLVLGVTADESWEKLDRIVDDKLIDRLKRVPGVATAQRLGGLERAIQVRLDRERLGAFGLSAAGIVSALRSQNLSNPGGNIRSGDLDFLVRTPEELASPEAIGAVVVGQHDGAAVRLRDVATVTDAFKEKTSDVLVDGRRGMMVFVQKQSGENAVAISDRVRAELEDIRRVLPPDVRVNITRDMADFIRFTVSNLRDSLLWGVLFVFLTIVFFLRNLRASVIVALSVPTSMIIAFVLMYLMGYTLNQVSLSSLAIAAGMVVDNAIVVLDNIHRHYGRGARPAEGAIAGSREVGLAVSASTFTTVAIFAPVIFVGGITSIIFGQLAAIITLALLASLLTALMFTPMLCSKLLRVEKEHSSRVFQVSEKIFRRIEDTYGWLLDRTLSHRPAALCGAVSLLVATLGLVGFIGVEFMPEEDQGFFSARVELPIGTRFENTGEVCRRIDAILRDNVPELQARLVRWGAGTGQAGPPTAQDASSYTGTVFAILVSKSRRNASPREVIERIRPLVDRIPGARVRFSAQDPLAGMIFGGGKALVLDIYGHDLRTALAYARDAAAALERLPGVTDAELSMDEARPELKVAVDRDKASSLGLDVTAIGKAVETYFSGDATVKYREGGDEYDMEVRLREEDRSRTEDLGRLFLATPAGRQVRLSSVARVVTGLGPTRIERKGQQRFLTVSADIQGRDLGSVVADAREALAKIPAPPGFSYKFSGAEKERRSAFGLLLLAVVLGMILTYMVMAAQFESLRDPFIIFLSVPFGFMGAAWFLAAAGETLSIISFIGVIMLIGIVVNNGIVLISYIGILRRRGLSVREAVVAGGTNRLRPVLSTTLTTVLALVPLVLSRGEGSEVWRPLSLTVIGGLLVSTAVTLLFMPALYSIFEERGERQGAPSPGRPLP